MVRLLGCALALALASCATSLPQATEGIDRSTPVTPPKHQHAPRVGLEYLAPERRGLDGLAGPLAGRVLAAAGGERPRHTTAIAVEPLHAGVPTRGEPGGDREPDRRSPWIMTRDEIARIENPLERFTMQFVRRVLGEDQRRVQRELSPSTLFNQAQHVSSHRALRTQLDDRDREDQELRLAREGRRLLNRPLRKALRDSSIVRDVELAFDEFKSENLPFSTDPNDIHEDDIDWGRISVRVRPTHSENPLELTYVRRNFRLGSGSTRAKASYVLRLTETVSAGVRADFNYAQDELSVWGDVHWTITETAQMHVLAGDRIDLLTGSRMYPLVQSPVVLQAADQSPGMMFYVEHMF